MSDSDATTDPRAGIRALCDRLGYSLRDLSALIGRRPGAVADFVRTGRPRLTDWELWLIADFAGVPPQALGVTDRAGPPPPPKPRPRRRDPAWPPPPPCD